MKATLGFHTGVECWQRFGCDSAFNSLRPCYLTSPPSDYRAHELERAVTGRFEGLPYPLHVLTNGSVRKRGAAVVGHVSQLDYPKGSFVSIEDGVYLASPELCFLQMASILPFFKLVELGIEFCGTYAPSFKQGSRLTERPCALSSPDKISRFLAKFPTVDGLAAARRAIAWVEPGSASPMETFLWMRLCLPVRLGGWGLPRAVFNHEVMLGQAARNTIGKGTLRCDLFYPDSKVAIEYESSEHHTGDERIADDSVRRGILESCGITVVTITKREFFTYHEFEAKVRHIARLTRHRLRKPTDKHMAVRRQMRDELLGYGLMRYRKPKP